jgi:hypothetical protein
MGIREKASRAASSRVDELLALHRELNPLPGSSVLVAIDPATGQLFLCASKGLCVNRDRDASYSEAAKFEL